GLLPARGPAPARGAARPRESSTPGVGTPRMTIARPCGRLAAAALPLVLILVAGARADKVTLRNGTVYHGLLDEEETVVSIFEGSSRTVIRNSKIAKNGIQNEAEPKQEIFRPQQPIEVHGGAMPKDVIGVKAGPWDTNGRRSFQYTSP